MRTNFNGIGICLIKILEKSVRIFYSIARSSKTDKEPMWALSHIVPIRHMDRKV